MLHRRLDHLNGCDDSQIPAPVQVPGIMKVVAVDQVRRWDHFFWMTQVRSPRLARRHSDVKNAGEDSVYALT